MCNNNTSFPQQASFGSCHLEEDKRNHFLRQVDITIAILIVALSLIAVLGNLLILLAIWKKNFSRTPFHIILSGLALTDLCTALIAQPVYAASTVVYLKCPRTRVTNMEKSRTMDTVNDSITIYFISITVFVVTFMSTERWLYMSRRALISLRRGGIVVAFLLIIPIPLVIARIHWHPKAVMTLIIIEVFSCYFITSFSYFKVYRIIRLHQSQVQANGTPQNFGRTAIDLAKYKKSVATIFYILLLFTISFLPLVLSFIISLGSGSNLIAINKISLVLLFSSSSFNPGLYIWRMKDIRKGVKQIFKKDS